MAGKSAVERLKDRLYSRKGGPSVDPAARTPLSPLRSKLSRSWDGIRSPGDSAPAEEVGGGAPPGSVRVAPLNLMPRGPRRRPFSSYFLWGALIFFVIASGVAAYTFFGGGNTISSSNIDLQIVAPSLVNSGDTVTVQYIIDNRNSTTLQNADIAIDYPQGTRDPSDTTQNLPHDQVDIGTIASGQELKETSSAVFYGAEGTQEQITATLEYQIPGSNAIFVKQAEVLFTIGSAPVSLAISAPSQVISGQPFTMNLQVSSNSATPLQNVAVQGQYPFGFSLASSTPESDTSGTMWHLGALNPGGSTNLSLTGVLVGQDGDQRVFHFLVGSESDPTETTIAVPLISVPETITVAKPFVSGEIAIDGQTGQTIAEPQGKLMQGVINWQNNLSQSVSDLTFTLSLAGNAVDPSSVGAQGGFYDSTKNQIVWNSQQDPALASVAPGASGTLQFSFATLQPSAGALVNPSVGLTLTVAGTQLDQSGTPQSVSSAASATIDLSSTISLSAEALHFSGPFNETGAMPPVAGEGTTYAIVWSVKNSSNSIGEAVVTATLPPYVTWDGAQTGTGENITYDDSTRTVTWAIGDLPAGVGYSSTAQQGAFEVTLTPSLSQVGQAPALTGEVQFQGQDHFAQTTVTASAPGPTTTLTNDSGFTQGMDIVSAH
ncbi:MAG: hypothetical protein KGJ34_01145 [Patescibacteria group bacterium]|nr:hypothetical protein [Patescibacteria group bacterium]